MWKAIKSLPRRRATRPLMYADIVGVEALNGERKRGQQLFQSGNQIRVTDVLHRTDHLKWRDLIHRIEVIHALLFVPIALMAHIDAEKPGLACRMWLAPLTDA